MATATKTPKKERPRPHLTEAYCKGCGRCVTACPKHCIQMGEHIDPRSGLTPVTVDLEACSGCGLCFDACPEPFGLHPNDVEYDWELSDPKETLGPRRDSTGPVADFIPDRKIPLPSDLQPLLIKGTYASAIGALVAGCRHFYGYPITPSTEGAELMAKVLPKLGGVFVQACSEVATVNHMYGAGGAGVRTMTFTSSPGLSLMLEGISYMIGAEVPGVFVNIMRGGPGLGNIGPAQSDIRLVCRALGHGNTHAIALAPADPQEMLDLTILAFDLAFKYRNPVLVLGDGYLGQVTGKVQLPDHLIEPGLPAWGVYGDEGHRRNLISSIELGEPDLERHNLAIQAKYDLMTAREQRFDAFNCDDADVLLVAANTPARMTKAAVQALRAKGVKAGLYRPVTLWPFPIDGLTPLLPKARRLMVVEASLGQLEDELRLALSHAKLDHPDIEHVHHTGGVLPQIDEIVQAVLAEEAER